MTDPLNWREWLVRQLRDDRLSDKEVASILAWHPLVTDEWRTPELKALMEAALAYPAPNFPAPHGPLTSASLAYSRSPEGRALARAHQEDKG